MSRKDDFEDLTLEFEQLQKQYEDLQNQHAQTLKDLEIMTKSRETGWKYVRELEVIEEQKKQEDLLIPQLQEQIEELKQTIISLKNKIKSLQTKKSIYPKGESINIRLPEGMRAKILEACPNISHFIRDAVNLQLNVKQTPQCE